MLYYLYRNNDIRPFCTYKKHSNGFVDCIPFVYHFVEIDEKRWKHCGTHNDRIDSILINIGINNELFMPLGKSHTHYYSASECIRSVRWTERGLCKIYFAHNIYLPFNQMGCKTIQRKWSLQRKRKRRQ